MNLQTSSDEHFVRRYEYDAEVVHALDLGVADGEATIDVVDGTAIVVVEGTDGSSTQSEFDLPSDDARAFIRNGVVTIEEDR